MIAESISIEDASPVYASRRSWSTAAAAWVRRRRWFLVLVILPTLLAALFYTFIAADVYVSESRFVIKSADQKRGVQSTFANLIQTTGLSAGQEQTNEILEYVNSRDALAQLERGIGYRKRFIAPEGDMLTRFPLPFHEDNFEYLYKFYRKMTEARLDDATGTAVISVKSFEPGDAYVINRELLLQSERLINRLNERVRTRAIAEAQRQVDVATERARSARVAIASFRNRSDVIDPARQAVGVLEISNGLIAQRAVMQAQLEQMARVAPDNPSIPALRQRIAAISGQIDSQNKRVTGTDSGIASKLGGYENLEVEQEFATESLTVANAGLVQAQAEAVRQQFYLERLVDPNVPDYALLPNRITSVLTIFIALLCLYFVGWMLVVGILEHSQGD